MHKHCCATKDCPHYYMCSQRDCRIDWQCPKCEDDELFDDISRMNQQQERTQDHGHRR